MKRLSKAIFLVAAIALSACTAFDEKKPAPKRPAATRIDASSFIEQLSLANITLRNGGSPTSELKGIEAFTRIKKAKPANITIARLDYTDAAGKDHSSLAPISENGSFEPLSRIVTALNSSPYTLKDVRVLQVAVAPGLPIKANPKAPEELAKQLSDRQQAVAAAAHKLPPLKEAQLQLKLLKHFTATHQRDAAYISADNAKRTLPSLPAGTDKAASEQLTKDMLDAESELKKSMPY